MTRSSLLILAGLACGSAWAHHSSVGVFDTSRTIEVTGTVESVSWRNPHGQIVLAGDDGREWHAETSAISMMRNRGISPGDVIAVGDRVTVAGSPPVRDVAEILAGNVLLPSGYEFDFGSGIPWFEAGRNGNLVGRASEGTDVLTGNRECRRHLPRVEHGHERSRLVSDVQGRLPDDARGGSRAR